MKGPATLAIVGFLLLVAQLVFGGALNRALDDSPLTQVPLALRLIFLWIAFWRGLAKGPPAFQLAVLLGFGSLATFGYATLARSTGFDSNSVYLAVSAALFILAITLGLGAYLGERARNHN